MTNTSNILYTPFYKHLFFDAYVLKEDGYFSEINCEIFAKYMRDNSYNTDFFTSYFNDSSVYNNYNVI